MCRFFIDFTFAFGILLLELLQAVGLLVLDETSPVTKIFLGMLDRILRFLDVFRALFPSSQTGMGFQSISLCDRLGQLALQAAGRFPHHRDELDRSVDRRLVGGWGHSRFP